MISPAGSLALTGVTVTAGRWAEGKTLSARPVVGLGFAAVVIAVMWEADSELASKFALLILLASVFVYFPAISRKLGLR